jgi:hypothetical protein
MEEVKDNVRSIIPFNQSKFFSHQEALELIPLLLRISAKTKRDLNLLNSQLAFVKANTEKAHVIQGQINDCLQNWSEKVRRLGLVPVNMCKVRIPGEGTSQYMWEYPDTRLYMH